jgi:hypothetical protein
MPSRVAVTTATSATCRQAQRIQQHTYQHPAFALQQLNYAVTRGRHHSNNNHLQVQRIQERAF